MWPGEMLPPKPLQPCLSPGGGTNAPPLVCSADQRKWQGAVGAAGGMGTRRKPKHTQTPTTNKNNNNKPNTNRRKPTHTHHQRQKATTSQAPTTKNTQQQQQQQTHKQATDTSPWAVGPSQTPGVGNSRKAPQGVEMVWAISQRFRPSPLSPKRLGELRFPRIVLGFPME